MISITLTGGESNVRNALHIIDQLVPSPILDADLEWRVDDDGRVSAIRTVNGQSIIVHLA